MKIVVELCVNFEFKLADGKCLAPYAKRTNHLEELKKPEDDGIILQQASAFDSRVFLSDAKERKHLR